MAESEHVDTAPPPLPATPKPQSSVPFRPAAAERRIWSVRDLVTDIRQQVEVGYADLYVEGEISNCRSAPSGHVYFTLKDGDAQLPVVLFRRQASLLRFRPEDGMAIIVRGHVSVYETRGQLQLIAEFLTLRGAGALQVAFEQLKARLEAEGLFSSDRKRPLPAFPRCVGLVTSPSGAVLRDIVTICRRRHARLNLLVYPAVMQGLECSTSIAEGIRWFNRHPNRVDLILIARGGGSAEDLSGFNDEALARTIASSTLPVVSAIGHETDFTIADFVADLRAATPSAAAELITAAQHRIEERLTALDRSLQRGIGFHIMRSRHRYTRLSADSVLLRLRDAVSRRDQRIDELRMRQHAAADRLLHASAQRLNSFTHRLRAQNVELRLTTGRRRLEYARQCLRRIAADMFRPQHARIAHATARLEALSPLAVLGRGYSLIYALDGTLLRSTVDVKPGEIINARLGKGSLTANVLEISKS